MRKFLIEIIAVIFISSFAIPVVARDRSQSSGRSETQRTEERTEGRTERKTRTERTGRIERTERKERTERRERKKREDTERREKSVEKARVEHKRRLRPEEIKFRRYSEKVQMATKRTFLSPWSKKVTGTRLGSFDISREEEVSIIIWSEPLPTKLAKRSSSQTEPVSIIIHMTPKGEQMRATYLDSAVLPSGETVSIILWSEPLPERIEKKLESSIISSTNAQSDSIATSQKLLVQMMEDFFQVVETLMSTTEGSMKTQGRVMRHVSRLEGEGEEEISATYLGSAALPNGEAVSIIIWSKPFPVELAGESSSQPVSIVIQDDPKSKRISATHLGSVALLDGGAVSIVIQEEPLPTRVVEESILERLAQIVMDSEAIEKSLDEMGRVRSFSYTDEDGKKHELNNIGYYKGQVKSCTETIYSRSHDDTTPELDKWIETKRKSIEYDEFGRVTSSAKITYRGEALDKPTFVDYSVVEYKNYTTRGAMDIYSYSYEGDENSSIAETVHTHVNTYDIRGNKTDYVVYRYEGNISDNQKVTYQEIKTGANGYDSVGNNTYQEVLEYYWDKDKAEYVFSEASITENKRFDSQGRLWEKETKSYDTEGLSNLTDRTVTKMGDPEDYVSNGYDYYGYAVKSTAWKYENESDDSFVERVEVENTYGNDVAAARGIATFITSTTYDQGIGGNKLIVVETDRSQEGDIDSLGRVVHESITRKVRTQKADSGTEKVAYEDAGHHYDTITMEDLGEMGLDRDRFRELLESSEVGVDIDKLIEFLESLDRDADEIGEADLDKWTRSIRKDMEYNELGQVISEVTYSKEMPDKTGITTRSNIQYNELGRVSAETVITYSSEAPGLITSKTHEYKYDELGRAAETKVTTHSYGIVFDADKLKKLLESLEVDTDEFKEFFESLGGNTDKFKELLKTMDVDTDELKELMRTIDYNKLAQAISEDTYSSEILSLFFRHKTITTVRMNTEYDEMGRVEKNTEITYSSETPGLITTTTERHKYDELGRVTETKVTTHSYGINLDGESIEDIEYDDFGRIIGYSYTDQDGDTHEVNNIMHDKTTTRTHIFTYNSSGQLEREIVYNHQTGELSDVDALKEMLSKMDADKIKEFLGSFDEDTKELLIKFLKDHKILIPDDNGDDEKDEEEEQ